MATGVRKHSINNQTLLLGGITSLIFGVLILTWPEATLTVITMLIGLWWLIQGLFLLLGVFMDRSYMIWKAVGGVIGVIAGIVALQNYSQRDLAMSTTLVFILGIMGIAIGITSLIAASRGEGWGIRSFGVISIIIGVTLIASIVIGTQLVLWIISGLLIMEGIIAILLAYK